jgi:DTW domain-containing protein YfiP
MVERMCICELIPLIENKTRVTLLIHKREINRTTNTGRLATLALKNSTLIIRGRPDEPLIKEDVLPPGYQSILLYPFDEAQVLENSVFDSASVGTGKINLIVPDGNWRQASKVGKREKMLADIPRVRLPYTKASEYFLRHEPNAEGLATLEAIARALGLIEGAHIQDQLEKLFRLMVSRTLESRPLPLQRGLSRL